MADAASAAAAVALFPQALVPIVVDLDVRGVRYVDSFLWTTGASCMTPEAYAAQTCDDLDLSVEMGHMLADAVRAQVAHALTLIAHAAARERAGRPLLPGAVVLVVDVTNGGKRFCDEFRWDTRAPRDAPEALARRTCDDMGLPSPFDVAIAFALRRELLRAALGAVAAESSATPQRTQPMPGGADPRHWRPRAAGAAAAPAPPEPGAPAPAPPAPPAPAPAPPGVAAPAAPLGHPADPSGFIVYAAAMQQQNPAILQDPNGTAMLYSGWANLPAAERDRYRAALAARRAQAPRAA